MPIRCIVIDIPKSISVYLERFRFVDPETLPEDRREVPSIAMNMQWSRFLNEIPSVDEGFIRLDRLGDRHEHFHMLFSPNVEALDRKSFNV